MIRHIIVGLFAVTVMASSSFSSENIIPGQVIVKYKQGTVRTSLVMNKLYGSLGVTKVKRFNGMMKGYESLSFNPAIKVQDAIVELERNNLVEYAQPNYVVRINPINQNLKNLAGPPGFPIPCIPGFDIPGCDPNIKLPCLIPGLPFPPGCDDSGNPGDPGNPDDPTTPGDRPDLKEPPAEVNPPVADPDASKLYGMTKIGADQAWTEFKGDKKMVVAVIDTGIDYNHEDLAFNVWRNPNPTKGDIVGYDFIHNDGIPYDDNEHGSHCSGTIGAVGGNGVALSGVNQRVSVMGLKFLSGEGSGTTEGAIQAIDYAVSNGAKVLSNSWGGPGDDGNQALFDAIERAKAKDVLFIAAAGNDGLNNDSSPQKSYPASFDNDNLITVAATDSSDEMAFFSNYGKKTTHIGAPGVDILSTTPGNKYAKHSGTSMACPHVAGAAALLWAKNPTWNYKKVKDVLLGSVDQLPSLQGKTVTGGRLNILKALRATE